jgi:hypothetical protein
LLPKLGDIGDACSSTGALLPGAQVVVVVEEEEEEVASDDEVDNDVGGDDDEVDGLVDIEEEDEECGVVVKGLECFDTIPDDAGLVANGEEPCVPRWCIEGWQCSTILRTRGLRSSISVQSARIDDDLGLGGRNFGTLHVLLDGQLDEPVQPRDALGDSRGRMGPVTCVCALRKTWNVLDTHNCYKSRHQEHQLFGLLLISVSNNTVYGSRVERIVDTYFTIASNP